MPPRNPRVYALGAGRGGSGGRGTSPVVVELSALPKMRGGPARGPHALRLMTQETQARALLEEEEEEEGGPSPHSQSTANSSSHSSSSGYSRHHRYEDPFTAYRPVSDPYGRAAEVERQRRFLSDSQRLGRPFISGGGGHALERPTRYLLGDCVAALYRTLARDWAEADPMVISTAEDLVVVYVRRGKVRHSETVLRYMNASLKRSEAVRAFDLRKVPEGWDLLTDDGHLMYTFKPPWVRQRRFLPDQVIARKAH